ncbi:thymidylate synthase [Paenibacillus chitinolyticus]|uniref:Thymidylate synthase n=1 Tax=Paenibacillus chitinolyticus TaxID=79263 RepID=A0A410WZC4_9BACL|nr:YdeI/OmpD-associated family protein [Paenibacillus chitinolyticus]MCY9590343.1 YdeI/OmpD-associated family protein [Paenibacillus chitinolyticus]MCY9596663.1 YdeI/OmpD-associated family protein [Paenibacillus chitinolyticus]QAV19667.1 thymidylate synthase [Paenibacillus chitinolyticus]
MEMNHLILVKSREELRFWLQENRKTEKFCWVLVSMTPKSDTLLYLDAVEEALCFGWIDGVKKKIAETGLAQRLSPRSKKSSWTELNKERVRRLEKLGLMTDEGRKVLPDMDDDSFRIDPVIEQRLKEEKQVYENFKAFPELYKRVRIDTIQSIKNQPELFKSRLDKFITNTRENKMYGQWNDNGRLLDY